MQIVNTLIIAAAGLFTASQAFVVTMYENADCTGPSQDRNVWDHACAYVRGFQSFKMRAYGDDWQQLSVYSQQACAGFTTFQGCAFGVNLVELNKCYRARNEAGGSNALSPHWSPGPCPI